MSDSNSENGISALVRRRAEVFIGQKFSRLTVLRIIGGTKRRGAVAECACECGSLKSCKLGDVRGGDVKSCGCLLREMLSLPTPLRQKSPFARAKSPRDYALKRASQERWKAKNQDKVKATSKRFRERHKGENKEKKAASYQRHKHKVYAKLAIRFKTDIRFRIEATIRARMRKALRCQRAFKSKRMLELLGCSLDELRAHLESQFTEGMSWNEVFAGRVHVDHVVPIRAFNLLDPKQQEACFHWSNLSPKWKPDNLAKSDFLPDGRRARFIIHAAPVPA